MRRSSPPVVTVLQFHAPLIDPEEVPEMPDTRAEVERAYETAAAVVQRGELQHLSPYQLAGHIHRAKAAHLAEMDDPVATAGLTPVDPASMRAAEAHPEDAAIDWRERGRESARRGEPVSTPVGHHPRSREAREFRAGHDEVTGATEAE